MARYDLSLREFHTPRGKPVAVFVREGTSDVNTAYSCLDGDEYGLKERHLTGLALDVGAFLGTVALALAVDNPGLRVVCVEPVPDNAALIRRNLDANGVADRVFVVEGLAGHSGTGTIRYGFKGNENELHHAYIGSATVAVPEREHTAKTVPSYSLRDIVGEEPVCLMKCDCEGGEWDFLDTDLSGVQTIVGERHPHPLTGGTKTRADLDLLLTGFDVTYAGPEAGPEGFLAERP